MPLAPQESLGSPIVAETGLRLPEEAADTSIADGVQSGQGRSSTENTTRACGSGRPPSLALVSQNESSRSPDDRAPPPPPGLEKLELSQIGSYDPDRSPLVCVSVHARSNVFAAPRVDAISPAERARSCSAEKERKTAFSFWENPGGGGDEHRPLEAAEVRYCCSSPSPSPSALSPPVDKLLRLPRGKSLRFFIDGEEGLHSKKKS